MHGLCILSNATVIVAALTYIQRRLINDLDEIIASAEGVFSYCCDSLWDGDAYKICTSKEGVFVDFIALTVIAFRENKYLIVAFV